MSDIKDRNKGFPILEFCKMPQWFRDKYLELAAESAAKYMHQGGTFMVVVKNIGFYSEAEKVGYVGWIETIDGTYFINDQGEISKPA